MVDFARKHNSIYVFPLSLVVYTLGSGQVYIRGGYYGAEARIYCDYITVDTPQYIAAIGLEDTMSI